MSYKKYRWSKDYEAAEEELESLLAHLDHQLERHYADAYDELAKPTQGPARQLWCAEGSMTVRIGQAAVSIQPGDAIDIFENQPHILVAGLTGCVWYEAPLIQTKA